MTFAQREIAAYAAEFTPDVAPHIVDAIVTAVGAEISTSEARDQLDQEQRKCDRRLHTPWNKWHARQPPAKRR